MNDTVRFSVPIEGWTNASENVIVALKSVNAARAHTNDSSNGISDNTNSFNGRGRAANFTSEVYTQVKITKIK